MDQTRNTSIYLDEYQIRYLKLISMMNDVSKSMYVRELIDEDMAKNSEICERFKHILYAGL